MDELIEALLECIDAGERQVLLREWPIPSTDLGLVEALKKRSDTHLGSDPPLTLRLVEIAHEIAAQTNDPLCRATVAWATGNAGIYEGDYAQCLAQYREALQVFTQANMEPEIGRLHANCVVALDELGRYQEALAEAALARPLLQAHGLHRPLASLELNAAALHRHLDNYGEALAACDRGRALATELGKAILVAKFDVNRALILDDLDSHPTAIATLAEALAVFDEQGHVLEAARARLNLGLLHTHRGHYREALRILGAARQGFAALNNEMEVAVVELHRAGVYLRLNLLPEAIERYAEAHRLFERRGLFRQMALADSEAAQAYHRIGEPETAAHLLARAQHLLISAGAPPILSALLDLLQAEFSLQSGAPAQALERAQSALVVLTEETFPIKRAHARLVMAHAAQMRGDLKNAAAAYEQVLSVVGPAGLAEPTYRAQLGLARLAEQTDDVVSALSQYSQAADTVTRACLGLGGTDLRTSFMVDKGEAHEAAVLLSLAAGNIPKAFACTEAGRISAGMLLSMRAADLDQGETLRSQITDEVAQQRDAWNGLYRRLDGPRWTDAPAMGAPKGPVQQERLHTGPAVASDSEGASGPEMPALADGGEAAIHSQLQSTQRRLADLLRSGPAPGITYYDPPADLQTIQSRLRPGEGMLAYFVARGQVVGFWLDQQRLSAAPNLASVEAISHNMDRLRLAVRRETADTQVSLSWFHRTLLAPFETEMQGVGRLFVVPHSLLHYLPFHALYDGQSHLLDRCEVVYLPAASRLRQRTAATPRSALVIGCDFGGHLPAIPQEVQAIHRLFAASVAQNSIQPRLLLGQEATIARVCQLAPESGILHLAAHGVFRQDSPLFSYLNLADGPLILADVERLSLSQTTLVTLSACETGTGDLRGGDLFGLSQAFLQAGAASLVASLWPVPDEATRELMIGFYRQLLAGQSKAAALRAAQLTLRAGLAHAHPWRWAGFVLIGDAEPL